MSDPLSEREITEALSDLDFLGGRLRGVLALAGRLRDVQALMATERDLRAGIADLQQHADAARAVIESARIAQVMLDGIEAELERHRAVAQAEAARIIEEALTAAQAIVDRSTAAAAHVADGARAEAARIIQEGRAKADAEAQRHEADVRKRHAQIASLDNDITNRSIERQRINATLDDLRARLGA
jgi:hypothetical protein